MAVQPSRLCGEEWQRWANSLLACHYGPTEYQRVQDNDQGDAGIEGFTVSEGHAYQAYGCEEPLLTRQRYEKQRNKMTTDIGKFIGNRSVLSRIFGSVRITRWILFVPYYDSKEIVSHASTKTEEVKAAALPYVATSFRVMVCDEDDFIGAKNTLINNGNSKLYVPWESATSEQVAQWASSHDTLAATLMGKLCKLPTLRDDSVRQNFHDQVLKWYLEGQSIFSALRKYPELYGKVMKAKSHRENFLVLNAISGVAAPEILTSALTELKDTLTQEVSALHAFSSEALAHEAVADWLLRCPLDFPEPPAHA